MTRNGAGKVYLFFSVNASGQFLGVAEMESNTSNSKNANDTEGQQWVQDGKWKAKFDVKWV